MKIAYFGIDLFADCLRLLVSKGLDIAAIFSYSNDPYDSIERVTEIAKEHNIPLNTVRVTVGDIARLENAGVDLMLVAGYAAKIPLSGKIRQVNIHPSLLPVGRGAWPMPVNILKNVPSGVTLHKLAEGFDTGDIILQEKIELEDCENLEALTQKITKVAPLLLKKFLSDSDRLFENAVPQVGGEYWPEPDDTDRTLTENDSLEYAELRLRAFYGYGVLYNGREILYGEAVREKDEKGEFLPLKNGYIRIKAT